MSVTRPVMVEQSGARHVDSGAGAAQLRLGDGNVLIGDVDLFCERIQPRILEDFPPLTTRYVIPGLRHFPAVQFLITGRYLHHRRLILRANRACRRCQCQAGQEGQKRPLYPSVPPSLYPSILPRFSSYVLPRPLLERLPCPVAPRWSRVHQIWKRSR